MPVLRTGAFDWAKVAARVNMRIITWALGCNNTMATV